MYRTFQLKDKAHEQRTEQENEEDNCQVIDELYLDIVFFFSFLTSRF